MPNQVKLPVGANSEKIQLSPNTVSLASTKSSSISSATSVTLNVSTSLIEVQAINQDVYLKYAAGVTTANNGFDEHIPADTIRHYVVPYGVTVISVIEGAATATVIIIEK